MELLTSPIMPSPFAFYVMGRSLGYVVKGDAESIVDFRERGNESGRRVQSLRLVIDVSQLVVTVHELVAER